MSVLILDHAQVGQLMSMRVCIDLMTHTLAALARGEAGVPLRSIMPVPSTGGFLGLMPAYLQTPGVVGAKVLTAFLANWGTEFESHQGVILLFEVQHGSLMAIVDAGSVTGIRTAAASAAATRALAREDAGDLAILGTGVQAEKHLEAMLQTRKIHRARVWSRSAENGRRFAERNSMRYGVRIEVAVNAREAVEGADLICTVTSSREPVLQGEWVAPGAHINAVGACIPSARELSTTCVVRSSLFTDRLESLLKEAGDFVIAQREGAIASGHVKGEIGQVFAGQIPGRTSQTEITLFKSLGIAVEDLACVQYLHQQAALQKLGVWLELGAKAVKE